MAFAPPAEKGIFIPQTRELVVPHANEIKSSLYHAKCLDIFVELYGENSLIVRTKELDSRFPEAHLGHVVRPDAVLIQGGKVTGIGEFQYSSNNFRKKIFGFSDLLKIFKEHPDLLAENDEVPQIPTKEEEIIIYFFSRINPEDFERNRRATLKGVPPFKVEYRQIKEAN